MPERSIKVIDNHSVVMYNPVSKVTITTIKDYIERWKSLGFHVINNVVMFRM